MTRTFVTSLRGALAALFAATAVFAVATPAGAVGSCGGGPQSGDYCYTLMGGDVAITNYVGGPGEITIPGALNGYAVAGILPNAFSGMGLTAVTLPDSLVSIGDAAFQGNPSLATINLPDSLVIIGDRAFLDCSLTTVVIPDSVTSIGVAAFAVNKLSTLTLGSAVASIRSSTFVGNSLTSVVIPSSVTRIDDSAFSGNQLSAVTMEGNEPATLSGAPFGSLSVVNDPLVTFRVGATYTPGATGTWHAGATDYRVQEVAAVTFDANGHGTAPASADVVVGQTVADPGNLTADGYRFDGWFAAPTGGTAVAFPLAITADTTLYAHWELRAVASPADAGAGASITVTGTGFEPGETVRIELHSDPVLLTTVVADGTGAVSTTVTIPEGTAPGAHSLVFLGSVTGTSSRDITIAANLAATGSNPAPFTALAVALIGTGLLLRRRAVR